MRGYLKLGVALRCLSVDSLAFTANVALSHARLGSKQMSTPFQADHGVSD